MSYMLRRDLLKSLAVLPVCGRVRRRASAGGTGDHARASIPLVRILRQAAIRSHRPLRAGHGSHFRKSHAAGGGRRHGGHDRPGRRRPLDSIRREPRLVLAAGLHAAMAARFAFRGDLERSRRRSLRQPHSRYTLAEEAHASRADLCAQSGRQMGAGAGLQPVARLASRVRLRRRSRPQCQGDDPAGCGHLAHEPDQPASPA